MWPFSSARERTPDYRSIDADFAIGGQIMPDDIPRIAAAGFRSILCARPDHEEAGQPSFAAIADAAERHGLKTVHIPVSGMLGEGQFIRMERALGELPMPMLGYCRSGARAGSLYRAVRNQR